MSSSKAFVMSCGLLVGMISSCSAQQQSTPLVSLDSHFPMEVPSDKASLEAHLAQTRDRVRLATGLLPMPELSEPSPVIHGRRQMKGYSVEKIYFESLPGYFVTGTLYRPEKGKGPYPIVLCPHGHWREGRFYDAGEAQARKHIASGAERFLSAARNHIQARCVQIARMGCIALQWDMAGYADNDQISMERIHGFRKQDAGIANTDSGWLLYSAQAESHLHSAMSLQTINALQTVRVAATLPDVDPKRIAMTGASGGGTQTFVTAAIDDTVSAAFPAVMVSTGMQGGCTCENACYLRAGVGNIDIAACIAPRPLGLTAADDWTRTMPNDGYPELKKVYALFGVSNRLQFTPLLHFGHNYNHISRVAFYRFLNQAFQLGLNEPILEMDFQRLEPSELTVWDKEHPVPEGGLEFERALLQRLTESSNQQLKKAIDTPGSEQFRQIATTAVDTMIGMSIEELGNAEFELQQKTDRGDSLEMTGDLTIQTMGNTRKLLFRFPHQWNGEVLICLHENGIAGVNQQLDDPQSRLFRSLANGVCIAAIDLQDQGTTEQPLVRQDRLAACYTFGYNPPLLVRRVREVMAFVEFVRNHQRTPKQIHLLDMGNCTPVVALASAGLRDVIDSCEISPAGFRFDAVPSITDPNFLPGGAKYFDIQGILSVSAPKKLTIHTNRGNDYQVTREVYEKVGASEALRIVN